MYPDRGIVHTYRRSDDLSTRPDNQNTLTCQSYNMNNAPRDPLLLAPLHGILPVSRICYVYGYVYGPYVSAVVTITMSTEPLNQEPTHPCIRYPTLAPSLASTVTCCQPFPTGVDSRVFQFYQTQLWFQFDQTQSLFSIRFDSRLTYSFLIGVTQFKSHSSQDLGIPTLERVSPKYLNTEIVEYHTIIIIEIGFGENTLIENKT